MSIKTRLATLLVITAAPCTFASSYINGSDITKQLNQDIQALPTNGILKIPAGTYMIDAIQGVQLKSNVTISMSPQTVLKVIPNDSGKYKLFDISNLNQVHINGGTLIGDKYQHQNNKGEWGMGIDIRNSKNIYISDIKINQMWGDGIYIGANSSDKSSTNTNIQLNNVSLDDNRRQGITLITGNKILLDTITVSNTKGTRPGAGIDIEPNNANHQLNQIKIKNSITQNNQGAGVQIGIKRLNNPDNKIDIEVINHTDIGSNNGILINDRTLINSGKITITNPKLTNNKAGNLCLTTRLNNNIKLSIDKPTLTSKSKNYLCRYSDIQTSKYLSAPLMR